MASNDSIIDGLFRSIYREQVQAQLNDDNWVRQYMRNQRYTRSMQWVHWDDIAVEDVPDYLKLQEGL